MLKWSPFSQRWCLNSIAIAGEGPSAHNLHGLNCPQIYNLALKKVDRYYDRAISTFSSALDALDKNPGTEANIKFSPIINADSSIFNTHDPRPGSAVYDAQKIKSKLELAKTESAIIKKELEDFSPKIPWRKKINFGEQIFIPVKYELVASEKNSTESIKVPFPKSECDINYSEVVEKAGLIPEEISIDGPDDADFSGYGCPYRIMPTPGSIVVKGSKVKFRSAGESG
ncbi:hypothetical protein [Oryzisolibacter propanilivorax]|nr:hypothetical protein [Oryzisolibacter propanilivorax]